MPACLFRNRNAIEMLDPKKKSHTCDVIIYSLAHTSIVCQSYHSSESYVIDRMNWPWLESYSELERQANIARNRALMEGLEINQISKAIGIAKAKRTAKPRQLVKRKQKEKAPRRRSVRLRNVALVSIETPARKKKREVSYFYCFPNFWNCDLQKANVMLHKLVEQHSEDIPTLNMTLKTIASRPHTSYDTQYDNGKRYKCEVKNLRNRLRSMKVVSRAKVNRNRIYSCAYHPDISKDLIFFGGMF